MHTLSSTPAFLPHPTGDDGMPGYIYASLMPTTVGQHLPAKVRAFVGVCEGFVNFSVERSARVLARPPPLPSLLSGVTLSFIIRAGEQARSEKFARTTMTTMRQRRRRQRRRRRLWRR